MARLGSPGFRSPKVRSPRLPVPPPSLMGTKLPPPVPCGSREARLPSKQQSTKRQGGFRRGQGRRLANHSLCFPFCKAGMG